MITLYQFEPALGVRNPSPFCLKLETYLRMAELPYEVAEEADVRKAPKKKLPYIHDGDRTVADSGFILDYLKRTYGDRLDQHLSPQEQSVSLAFCRLMEEHLYWATLYSRWAEADNWAVIRQVYFSELPPILRKIVPAMVRRDVLRNLYGHGMGRHSRAEIYEMGQNDIKAISDFLADKPFLMGEQPTSLDATGYGFLANLFRLTLPSVLSDFARQFENLENYCDRMEARFWA
ncbi:glutathione S-transferase family protein [Romeria aff. gracilis LEGE 07310]|uniref:Glutathione S-transferase family protein n=1 Tax=Vasconcelosia minhoensis LEGE 07310 TaxID=915328 RepID=A0A8J7DR53_9CYAN|nr:glutathione S-transferase family protein [Romeria gracilis]MBE9077809.1 glutathione S-transferase family protein [Romeria aff. gracilis LEGE 07310]